MHINLHKTFFCAVLLASGAVQAADAARGAQLYMRTDNDGRSCVSCHGPDPGINHNNILRAADQPGTLTKVLNTVSVMGFLRSQLSDVDRADISAFLGSVARLNDADAGLRMWPVTIDFGATPVAGVSASQTVHFTNLSRSASLPLTSISSTHPQIQLASACPPVLAPAGACEVQVRHQPAAPGLNRAALEVTSPVFTAPVYVAAAGSGALGPLSQLVWQPAAAVVRFDAASNPPLLRQVIALVNPGPMPAVLGLASIVGPDASRFRIESGCAQGAVLVAGTQCDMALLYSPSLLPLAQAVLQVRSDQGNPASVRLEGGAAAAAPQPSAGDLVAAGDSGGGCTVGPPGRQVVDPSLLLAALLAAWMLTRQRGRKNVRHVEPPV